MPRARTLEEQAARLVKRKAKLGTTDEELAEIMSNLGTRRTEGKGTLLRRIDERAAKAGKWPLFGSRY